MPPQGATGLLRDPRTWVLCAAAFGAYVLANAVSFWTPQIIEAAGVQSTTTTGPLAAIPPCTGMIAMIANGWHSDRAGKWRRHVAGGTLLGALEPALLVLLAPTSGGVAMTVALLCLVTIGHHAGSTMFWTMPALYYRPQDRASGIAVGRRSDPSGAMPAPAMLGTTRAIAGSPSLGLLESAAIVTLAASAHRLRQDRPHSRILRISARSRTVAPTSAAASRSASCGDLD